jgi:orotidine-5'-phosphate decarboxylase
LRALAPGAPFLVPGYGAQGSGARDALAGFVRRGNRLEGGVVNASRSVTFPASADTAGDMAAWTSAIRAAIDAAQADLVALSGATENAGSVIGG